MSNESPPIRVLICDDHAIIRKGLEDILRQADFEIAGVAETLQGAIELIHNVLPDVVILDLNMDSESGIRTLEALLRHHPKAKIVVFSMRESLYTIAAAYDAGAKGYVTKAQDPMQLVSAIKQVANGGTYFTPGIAERIVVYKASDKREIDPTKELGPKDLEIFRQLAEGKSYEEIGHAFNQPSKTIENRAVQIRKKLNVTQGDIKLLAVKFDIISLDM